MNTTVKIDKARAREAAIRVLEMEKKNYEIGVIMHEWAVKKHEETIKNLSDKQNSNPFGRYNLMTARLSRPSPLPSFYSHAQILLAAFEQTTYSTIDMSVEDVAYLFGERAATSS